MDSTRLALADQLLAPRRKPFLLWIAASLIILSLFFLTTSFKGRIVTPFFSGFNSVTRNSSLVSWPFSRFPSINTTSSPPTNVIGVVLEKTHVGNFTGITQNGSFGDEEATSVPGSHEAKSGNFTDSSGDEGGLERPRLGIIEPGNHSLSSNAGDADFVMPPIPSSLHIFHPCLNHYLKPNFFSLSYFSISAPKFPLSSQLIPINPRTLSSVANALSPSENGSGGGGDRSSALAGPPVLENSVQKIDVNPPKGTRDFPPEEMRLRNWLFHNFREVSRLSGFEEVDYPVLESEALFIRKAGEEIRDQLYCFEDRGNRRVALRPELTPSLARLVIQKGKSLSLPLKWFAIGQCWRYERMTRGRRREHYQWNMDIIGVPEVTAEAELISSIVTFFKKIGISASDVGFKVNSRKVLQEILRSYSISENLFAKVCVIIDKIEKIPIDEIKKELKSVGMPQEAVNELLEVLSVKSLSELEEILGGAGEAIAELKQLFSLAEKFGYSEWIQFDASVVRGLAYYTGIVFEGFDRAGKLRAICGGGRYDRLLSTFGGDDLPACGFGFGDAVIIELLKEKGILPGLVPQIENIVCALDHDLQGAAATVATMLREKGQSVDLVLESKPLKWVFKRAARINAQRLILVGNTEWKKGMVSVKILSSGEQSEIKLDELE